MDTLRGVHFFAPAVCAVDVLPALTGSSDRGTGGLMILAAHQKEWRAAFMRGVTQIS